MKKIIALALVLLVLPSIAFASLDTNLYYGVKNQAQVRELQEFLIDKGLLNSEATGNFYSLTLKAVKKYQELQGLPQTGYVGTMTRGAINQELATLLVETEAELAQEPAQPTQPVVPQSYGTPIPQQPVAQVVESKKDIIVETTPAGECVSLKVVVLDEDGDRIVDGLKSKFTMKVTADTYPNRVNYIGITDVDNSNEYMYCPPEEYKHEPANITFIFSSLNLRKVVTVTP